jgi:predicted acetyltransferase
MPDMHLRTLSPDDSDAVIALDRLAFPFDDEGVDPGAELSVFEWDRTRGVFWGEKDQELAGQYTTYSLTLPVPGGKVATGGLSWVGVHPHHRRRGVLRAMMADHLALVRERGEAISVLTASEAAIYGRFGYGVASLHLRSTVRRGSELRDVPGWEAVDIRIERADAGRHTDLVNDCYELAAANRPGMVARPTPGQRRHRLWDPAQFRDGGERLLIMIAGDGTTSAGGVSGYALFRRRMGSSRAGMAAGQATIREIVARDPATARALWGRLLDLDLTTTVQTDDRPSDDPLHHLLVDRRAAESVEVDGIWIRLVDLPAALAARRYAAALDVVFAVRDRSLPENDGTWRLTGGPENAACEPGQGGPAFEIDVRELGSAYLGSITLDALASAGLVTINDHEAFAAASRAFSWPVAAYCGWRF